MLRRWSLGRPRRPVFLSRVDYATVSAQANQRLLRPSDGYSDWTRKLSRSQKDNWRFLSSVQSAMLAYPLCCASHATSGRRVGAGISWSGCNLKRARQPESLTVDRRSSPVPLWFLARMDPIFYFLSRPRAALLRLRPLATLRACVQHPSQRFSDGMAWKVKRKMLRWRFFVGPREHVTICGVRTSIRGDGLLVNIPGLGAAPRMMSDAQALVLMPQPH